MKFLLVPCVSRAAFEDINKEEEEGHVMKWPLRERILAFLGPYTYLLLIGKTFFC